MAKRLAGKRWFYAAGARAKATGINTVPKAIGSRLPRWAQSAFSRGWFHEHYAMERAAKLHASAWDGFKAQYPSLTDAELESRGFVKEPRERATQAAKGDACK